MEQSFLVTKDDQFTCGKCQGCARHAPSHDSVVPAFSDPAHSEASLVF